MPVMDPFQGAKSENDDQQKALLDVIAQSGSAGRKEYENAQAQAQQQRQNALDYAAQRQRITGSDFGPTVTAPVTEAADRFNTYFGGQNAAFQNHLSNIGNSAQSYLAKVNAIAPFVQAQNQQQASDRENQLKMAIAANQAKIDADKAAEERQRQFELQKMAIAHQYDNDTASRAKAAKEPDITLPQLVGLAQQVPGIFNDTQNILGQTKEGVKAGITGANLTQRAGQLGAQAGVSQTKLAGLTEPGFQAGVNSDLLKLSGQPGIPPLPSPMTKDWITQNVIMPGTNKLATASRADDVLRAPELQAATDFITDLAGAKIQNGRLNDPLFGEDFKGMSPKDAFNAWIDAQPGIATMKAALKQYYAPYLDQIGR